MKTYTVLYYSVPDGRNLCETVEAPSATQAAIDVRDLNLMDRADFEVIAVIVGMVEFAEVDHAKVNLFP